MNLGRTGRHPAVLSLFFFAPLEAQACGICVNREIAIHLPAMPYLLGLCLLWGASNLAVRCGDALAGQFAKRFRGHAGEREVTRPKLWWMLAWIVAYVGLLIVTMGSVLGPALVLVPVWLGALLLITRAQWKSRPAGKAARACFHLNVLFLLGAGLSVAYGGYLAHSVKHLVGLLDYEVPSVSRVVVPRVVARGEPAVGPLIKSVREEMENKPDAYAWIERQEVVRYASYCLGRIGGPQAVEFLRGVVRERIDFNELRDHQWQRAVCAAYAQCAGPKAAPDLKALYDQCPAPPVNKWSILAALAKTGSREGVNTALDHIDVLFERASIGGSASEIAAARAALSALIRGLSVDELKGIPLFRHVHMVGTPNPFPEGDVRNDFYFTDYALEQLPNTQALRDEWQKNKEQLIAHWNQALDSQ